ncbi:MAG: phosphate signaling complex protein PhoU [bacterium]
MRVHFQREIDKLKRQILEMSADVEEAVSDAVQAVESRDVALAKAVVEHENQTNARDVDVEEECLKILALHQPVAADLRYLVAVLKINHDLERIGDLAAHIAQGALLLCEMPPVDIPLQLGEMAAKSQQMLKKVLDAFVNVDIVAARETRLADSDLDALNRAMAARLKGEITRRPELLEPLLKLMHIARHLERIGDHATNIAEDLIYLIEGKIVRHTSARQS